MTTSKKQFLHYQGIAQQSLDKFKKVAKDKQKDNIYDLVEGDWQAFVDNEQRLQRYIDHVEDVASIFGFSRELSDKLSYEDLMSRAAERFAEVDLAEHAIRELYLPNTGGKLEKLPEGAGKKCDFRLAGESQYFFEAKYTKNIAISNLTSITKDALEQIRNSMDGTGIGVVWIFTYSQPDEPRAFQESIEAIKQKFRSIGFTFKLNVQSYGRGLYGDATVI